MNKRQMDFTPVKRKTVGGTGATNGSIAVKRTTSGTKTTGTVAVKRTAQATTVTSRATVVRRTATERAVGANRSTATVSRTATAAPRPAVTRQSARGGVRTTVGSVGGSSVARRTTSGRVTVAKSGTTMGQRGGRSEGEFKISGGRRLGEIEDLNPRFVRTDVPKRPLSKNVYQKTVVPAKEPVTKKPTTIIAKPKRESHVGIVVTIILTIIFGAVAGTVAFLLLPK